MPYTSNPDMIAFTIGRLVLKRVGAGEPTDLTTLSRELVAIASGEVKGRISPEMAASALDALRRLTTYAA